MPASVDKCTLVATGGRLHSESCLQSLCLKGPTPTLVCEPSASSWPIAAWPNSTSKQRSCLDFLALLNQTWRAISGDASADQTAAADLVSLLNRSPADVSGKAAKASTSTQSESACSREHSASSAIPPANIMEDLRPIRQRRGDTASSVIDTFQASPAVGGRDRTHVRQRSQHIPRQDEGQCDASRHTPLQAARQGLDCRDRNEIGYFPCDMAVSDSPPQR